MLASRLGSFETLRVADLFAGSGALGLEALSRGAGHCLFVERDKVPVATIRKNIAAFNAEPVSTVHPASVMELQPATSPLDLILLDPPYGTSAANVALDRLLRLGWIGAGTWIAVETSRLEDVAVDTLALLAERKVGKAKVSLLQVRRTEGETMTVSPP